MQDMPSVEQLIAALSAKTRPDETPEWDPVGLQLGDRAANVGSLAVCHEVTEEVLEALEESPVDMLVTYHPLLFQPTNRILSERSPGGRAFRLLSIGVNLLVTHTDFDAAEGGTADGLAELFDLRDTEPFGADPDTGLPPIGRVGGFVGTLGTVEAVLADTFGPMGCRVSGDRETEIETLAVIPGSGSSLIPQAAKLADALVTGDVSHHSCVAARDLGLAIVDPGHIATERPGMEKLVEMMADVSGMEVRDLTALSPQTWS